MTNLRRTSPEVYLETTVTGTGFLNDSFYVRGQYNFVCLKGGIVTIYAYVSPDKTNWARVIIYNTNNVNNISEFILKSGGYWIRFECSIFGGDATFAFYGGA